ncbi:hypothetical protein [Stenotrophomonas sp. CFBP8980]|uniref:hypothetical protein n=1 Tax=Stenotrophomonas sp. CFBP8980 TaxID=3096523 RepID=UPI002A698F00|nr:hypothetical protein [Stenotrophomonas sp. CFBP8980]MDY1035132.1 hypothetical protein [Stenotrophomonas sp. CFBP8980]
MFTPHTNVQTYRKGMGMIRRNVLITLITVAATSFALMANASNPAEITGTIEQRFAPIHSEVQLQDYLVDMPATSPLLDLSDEARARFVSSLKFNHAGLVSYSYADVQAELTATQAYRLLALFGAQRTLRLLPDLEIRTADDERVMHSLSPSLFLDHPGYECTGSSTCSISSHKICMGGC